MKNKIKNIYKGIVLSCFMCTLSCNEYLSTIPDNRTAIDSKEKVTNLLTVAYPEGNYQEIAELMSDNADDKGNIGAENNLSLHLYKWEESNLETQDTPTYYWNSCYNAIAQANQALESIKEIESKNKNIDCNPQKGEALLARAYAHFMLVTFWAKAYNPTTSKTDLGIPYVVTPEKRLLKKYKRNTVQEVYDFIEKDLIQGLKLVGDTYEQPKFHFTKESGYAFATRFYLQKGDWDKVLEYSSEILSSNPSNEIRDVAGSQGKTYSELKRNYASHEEPTNLLIVSTSSLWARQYDSSRFGLSSNMLAKIFYKRTPFNNTSWAYGNYGIDFYYNIPKYEEYFKYTNLSTGTGYSFLAIVLFSKDEVLLNRAEAYAMKKQYTNALNDLTVFLSKKIKYYQPSMKLTEAIIKQAYPVKKGEFTPFYTIESGTQESIIKSISEFKRREFYHEGLRWFDIKRFHLEVTHLIEDGKDMVLKKNDPRRELQIPLTAQKTLIPNKR